MTYRNRTDDFLAARTSQPSTAQVSYLAEPILNDQLAQLDMNVNRYLELKSKTLLPNFSQIDNQAELTRLIETINIFSRQVVEAIKQLYTGAGNKQFNYDLATSKKRQLDIIMNKFNNINRHERQLLTRQAKLVGLFDADQISELRISSSDFGVQPADFDPTRPLLSTTMISNESLDLNSTLILERDREIRQIAQGVNDISMMMQDLNIFVEEQGQMVDSITHKIADSNRDVEMGLADIKIAKQQANKLSGKTCLLLMIIIAIITVGATILVILVK